MLKKLIILVDLQKVNHNGATGHCQMPTYVDYLVDIIAG